MKHKDIFKLLALLCLATVVFSCETKDPNEPNFHLSLDLKGFEDSTTFYLVDLDKLEPIDSTNLMNGQLTFEGKIDNPISAKIKTVDNKYLVLWIEQGTINVNGTYEDFGNSNITGSPLNAVMTKYRDQQSKLQSQRETLMQQMFQLMNSQEEDAQEKFQGLSQQVKQIDQEVFEMRINGIVNEPPSYYTIQELFFLRNDFTKDSLKSLFDKFPESLKNTKYGQVIDTYIQNKPLSVGDQYADIEGINIAGDVVKLSKFNGKYVLLDFWASWCRPCRQEHPNLVKAYEKYNGDGFEIFSFSIDNNKSDWTRAIEKDSLIWTNVIDENGRYSKMSALYGVRAIPASFLINPEGKIIATGLRGDKLEERLASEFGKSG
ncbi:MAG: thioredoxin-like domain-containing protein [Bacteroidota bacterium]